MGVFKFELGIGKGKRCLKGRDEVVVVVVVRGKSKMQQPTYDLFVMQSNFVF